MKKMYLLLLLAVGFLGTNGIAQDNRTEVQNGARIDFETEMHDYGTIENGADPYCTFEFTNTGNAPLIISKAQQSCGCTVPSWPKEPIAPGKSATIKVKYDTKRTGAFNKSVTISSNAVNNPTVVLRIKGVVKAKPVSGSPLNSSGPSSN